MNISVMDNGANLVGFLRMDGAWLGSVDIAMKKVGRQRYRGSNFLIRGFCHEIVFTGFSLDFDL